MGKKMMLRIKRIAKKKYEVIVKGTIKVKADMFEVDEASDEWSCCWRMIIVHLLT